MNETRRRLLILGALTAVSAALPLEAFGKIASKPDATAPPPTDNEYTALSRLTPADFQPFVGAAFNTKSQDAHSVRLTLTEVQTPPTLASNSTTPPPAPDPNTYALRFKGVSGKPLPQGTYVLNNSGLEPFAIFLVPAAAAAKPMYYTGNVNRSVQ